MKRKRLTMTALIVLSLGAVIVVYAGTVGVNDLFGFTNGYGFTDLNSTFVNAATEFYRNGVNYTQFIELLIPNHDQELNTTDLVTFASVNATNEYYRGPLNYTDWLLGKADIATTKFDQSLNTTDAIIFITVDTGEGANELYDMDQNIQTTNDVVFNSANLTTRSEFGTQFNVTAEINSNWEWSGDVVLLQAHWNTSLSQGKLVYIDTNGTLQNTDADSSTSVPCIGITLEAITADTYGLVLTRGWIYNSAWTLDEGRDVYVSTTAGDVTVTLPNGSGDQIQVVGIGISEDLMLFNPDYTILEIV